MIVVDIDTDSTECMLKCIYRLTESSLINGVKQKIIRMDIPKFTVSIQSKMIRLEDIIMWYEAFPKRFSIVEINKSLGLSKSPNAYRLQLDVSESLIQHHSTDYALWPSLYTSKKVIFNHKDADYFLSHIY